MFVAFIFHTATFCTYVYEVVQSNMKEKERKLIMRMTKKNVLKAVATVLLLVAMMSMTVFAADAEVAELPKMFATPYYKIIACMCHWHMHKKSMITKITYPGM